MKYLYSTEDQKLNKANIFEEYLNTKYVHVFKSVYLYIY